MQVRSHIILLVCFFAIAGASPLDDYPRESDRSLRIGNNNVETSTETTTPAYSVSFVPLFSLLASFIPKLFSRFSGINQQPASREFRTAVLEDPENDIHLLKVNNSICSTSRIGQWEVTDDCYHFYTCTINPEAPSHCQNNKATTTEESEKARINKDFSTSKNDERLSRKAVKINTYSNDCITMTVYKCLSDLLYISEAQQCISKNKIYVYKKC